VEQFAISIIGIGIFQSIVGISQFFLQHSLGLTWLKESIISQGVPGVAKIILNNHKIIRAYGLMPHPNILGGFLATCLILLLYSYKLFHADLHAEQSTKSNLSQIVPRGTISIASSQPQNESFYPRISSKKSFYKNIWLIYGTFLILLLSLLLTLSKSAILGLCLALAYIFIIVPRGTIISRKSQLFKNIQSQINNLKKMFHVEHFRIYTVLLAITLVSLFLILKPNLHSIFIQSLEERGVYLDISYHVIAANPILGVGVGQFVWGMQTYSHVILLPWQYQPVHNVFLLILSELGISGLGLYLWLIWVLIDSPQLSIVPRGAMEQIVTPLKNGRENSSNSILNNIFANLSNDNVLPYFKAIMLIFLFIMLFDHYFWDIQQGSLMLWMVLGVIAGMEQL
jgi:hypothetical protein